MRFEYNGKEFYIDGILANQLMSIAYNVKNDHDFIIVITGDRTVRVGKSVMGLVVCAFLAFCLKKLDLNDNAFGIDNVYFDNQTMLKKAITSPPYTIHQYDEGREGLAASKYMKDFQKDLMDFFAECGQLKNIFVIVLPDFFELKEDIAVARSEFLINVYRKDTKILIDGKKFGFPDEKIPITRLDRGQFEFFSRKKKAVLYDVAKSKHQKRYNLIKCNFYGKFTNQYPVDEAEYREKKRKALLRFVEKKKDEKKEKGKLTKQQQKLYDRLTEMEQEGIIKFAKKAADDVGSSKGLVNNFMKTAKTKAQNTE